LSLEIYRRRTAGNSLFSDAKVPLKFFMDALYVKACAIIARLPRWRVNPMHF
jgi:hypothetical protein